MSTPIGLRNEKLAERIIKHLNKRFIEGYYCNTSEEAIAKAKELMEEECSVTWGGSMTIRDMGLTKAILDGNYNVFNRDTCSDPVEMQKGMRDAFSFDWYITSANAITQDGEIINIDGLGNRISAITFGPKNVLFIIGMNKVTTDVECGLKRARSVAATANTQRLNSQTPCVVDGVCHDCYSPGCVCCVTQIIRMSKIPNRIKVILVDEVLGY